MQARKKSSKLAHFLLLPFSLCLVGGVVQVVVSEVVLAQTTQDRKAEADRLIKQGVQLYQTSLYQESIKAFESALGIYRDVKDLKGEATSLLGLGSVNRSLGQYQKAIDFYQRSLAIFKQIGDRNGEAKSFNNLGYTYGKIGQYQQAIDFYQKSLAIYKKTGDREGEASSLNNLGSTYESLEQYQKATDFYHQSLAILKQIGDRDSEAVALNNLGGAYERLGQYQKALDFYKQALAINKQVGNRNGEATSLGNLGLAYYSLGQYQKTIDFYQQSLAIKKQSGDRNGEATSLLGLGVAYSSLGQYQKAIDLYQQSLVIKKQSGDRNGEAASLNNLGLAYYKLGQYQKTIDFLQQSLEILKQISGRNDVAVLLNNLGLAYKNLGQYQKAIDFYQQSLAITKPIGDRDSEAVALNNLGGAYERLGQYQKAIDFYQQSLTITKQIGNRFGEATSLNNLGGASNELKQPELAILFYKQSVNVQEAIRKDLQKLDKDLQQSYLATVEKSYRNLANLLLQQNRIIEALQVLDLLKVQELEDYLKNIKGSDRSAQGVRLLSPELALSDKLLAISFDNSKDINNQLANQIQQLPKSEINKVPDYLNQISQGTVLLYPFILGDRLEIILFAPNNLPIRRTVKISKDQLQELVTDFRSGLQNNGYTDVKIPAAKLYDLLIKPIEADLIQFKADTILYAPDGQLRYVPLAALYDGKQWLIEKYRISNLIAYTLTDFTANPKTQPSILAGAYGNGNYKTGETALPPLPATIKEVQAISNSFTNSVTFIEDKFSRQAIESQLKNYNILHLATHAEFNTGVPDNSFIIFGNGDKIRLNEITDWQIPNINLIILSACQTGLGKLGEGVEILGFGYQVQKAGAKNAIASLWKVDDSGTQALMEAFYGELQKGDVSIVEALRRAQIAMINSDKKGTGSDRAGIRIVGTVPSSSTLSHPYYWSAFFAIGNGL
ncbi:CHAT domain-containing protein [Pseudanabaena sp. UWO310]|uniref:CHAT domain-containing protein n=1 Tax=Pseudanabaena sp. UWO310 TaxID=2480795 RepID=UPI001CC20D6F|nr:tetratricopeptide repeat protein [Pseudanabaena sp. UWO310]